MNSEKEKLLETAAREKQLLSL